MHVITYMYNKIHKQSVIFRCFRLILVASQKHHIGYFLACAYVPPTLLPFYPTPVVFCPLLAQLQVPPFFLECL